MTERFLWAWFPPRVLALPMSDPYCVIMQQLLSLPWLLSRFEACSGQDRFTTGAVKLRRLRAEI